jgi:hypothetical protein
MVLFYFAHVFPGFAARAIFFRVLRFRILGTGAGNSRCYRRLRRHCFLGAALEYLHENV